MTTVLDRELNAIVKAGLFRSREEALTEAVNVLFAVRPAMRLEAAIALFKDGDVSLSRAAEMAGIDVITFHKLLADRGIPVTIECGAPEEMDADIADFFEE
jgi:predicted HTH domain antitoxin